MQADRPATWRLTVTNDGPSVADNVVLSDVVPEGMSFVPAAVEGGAACPPPEQSNVPNGDAETILRCPLGSLDVGTSAAVVVTFQIEPGQEGADLCNAAIAGSGSLDPDALDNEDEACGIVEAPPETDVGLTFDPPSQTQECGDTAEFTAIVRVATEWPPRVPQPPNGVVGSLTFDVPNLARTGRRAGPEAQALGLQALRTVPGDGSAAEGRSRVAHDAPPEFPTGKVFASIVDAQAEVDRWVWRYNHEQRPDGRGRSRAPGREAPLSVAAVAVTATCSLWRTVGRRRSRGLRRDDASRCVSARRGWRPIRGSVVRLERTVRRDPRRQAGRRGLQGA
jgi:uncharacterized repeat protein (TIGR01451 family)